jgi:amidase
VAEFGRDSGMGQDVSEELWTWSATELAGALRARRVSAREVMESHLARIDAVNSQINAIVTLDADGARVAADRADRVREPFGLLHGVPVVVKDLEDTRGMRTTYGSPLYADHVPTADSIVVERWRAAGAIVIGKSNTPEFGAGSQTFNRVFGATRNPHDVEMTSGGSSGGSAAAVASGLVPLADGSDLGASIRNPASFCNLVGLRPSPGRVPSAGGHDPWNPYETAGALARTVSDAALALRVLAGPHPRAPLSLQEDPETFGAALECDPAGLRVAWSRTLGGLPVEPEVTQVLDLQRQTFVDLGCIVEDLEPDLDGADEAFDTLRALSFAGSYADIIDEVKPDIALNVRRGLALTGPEIARAYRLRGEIFERLRVLLTSYDVLAGPVAQTPPFSADTPWPRSVAGVPMTFYTDWFRSCSRISVSSHPAISVPAGFTSTDLPVGLQLIGRYRDELGLLRVAAAYEEATQFHRRLPDLPLE